MKGLLLVTMEPPAGLEEEFNDWYDTEHFPQRRGLPGVESASRWVCLQGWPRWVALYDLTSVAALETPEYRAVSGPNSTPWSRRLLPRTVGRARVVAEQIAPGDALGRPPGDVAQLVLARYGRVVERPAAGALPGLLQLRLFRTTDPAAQSWVAAEFDRPQAPDAIRDAFGAVDGAGALQLNLYAPYHRG
jgi:hypothetical protein